jgi:hypothetical protein
MAESASLEAEAVSLETNNRLPKDEATATARIDKIMPELDLGGGTQHPIPSAKPWRDANHGDAGHCAGAIRCEITRSQEVLIPIESSESREGEFWGSSHDHRCAGQDGDLGNVRDLWDLRDLRDGRGGRRFVGLARGLIFSGLTLPSPPSLICRVALLIYWWLLLVVPVVLVVLVVLAAGALSLFVFISPACWRRSEGDE